MSRPSLLIMSFSDIVSDARVLKQVALLKDQYRLTTCGYGQMPEGSVEHIPIPTSLVYWRKNRVDLILRRYGKAYWGNEVIKHLTPLLAGRSFDIVLANDVDTVPLALSLKRRGGVHVDLHEYAPRMGYERWRWRFFVAGYMTWLVREHVTRAESATTVAPGIAKEYASVFGLSAGIVKNATPLHDLEPTGVHTPLRLVHSGAAIRGRQLEVMIEAMRGVDPRDASFDFYLTKNDECYLEELHEMVEEIPAVRILDPVPYRKLIDVLHQNDVGVHLLAPTNFNNQHALPNKLFDFVQARLGVIVGPSPEMAREVKRHRLGCVLPDFTAASLRRLIQGLSAEQVETWKAAAHRSASQLSAETQEVVWQEAIDALAPGPRD